MIRIVVWLALAGTGALLPAAALATPFAYITNHGDDTVTVIDTASDTVAATVPVGPLPFGVAAGDQTVFVTNEGDQSVSVINAVTNRVSSRIEGAGGYGVAVSPDGTFAYVARAGGYQEPVTLSIISSAEMLKAIPVGLRGRGDDLFGVTVSPDGAFAYMLTTLDTEQYPCHLALTSCRLILHIIDTQARELVSSVTIFNTNEWRPAQIALSRGADRLYVAAENPYGELPIVGIPNGNIVGGISSLYSPVGIAFSMARDRAYVTDGDTSLYSVDTKSGDILKRITVGARPFGVAVNPCETRVYVANTNDDTVSIVDTGSDEVINTLAVGREPEAFGQFIGPGDVGCPPTVTAASEPSPTPTRSLCTGDCNGDRLVTIDELLRAVSIALCIEPPDSCAAVKCSIRSTAIGDGCNGGVGVECLVAAVKYAISGCPQ